MRHLRVGTASRRDDAVAIRTRRAKSGKVRPKEEDRPSVTLERSGLFLGLTGKESRMVARRMEDNRFVRGETIFRRHDPCDSLYVIKEGIVKLVSRPENGTGTILRILRPTDVFGELLLAEARRPFNALAVTDVLAGVFSREEFIGVLSAIPRVRLNFIRILSRRLSQVEKEVTEFSHTRSYQRLAKVLLRLCGEHGKETPGGIVLRLSLTHADLAEMIGTTRETVTNQLKRFRRMGLVWGNGRRLLVNRRRLADDVRSEDAFRNWNMLELAKSA